MPYCPKCKAEYREGFTKCADCNVDLVDELREESETDTSEMPDGIKMEHLVRANNHIELSYITSMLSAEGIYWKPAGMTPASFLQSKRGQLSPRMDIFVDSSKINEAMAIVLSIAGEVQEEE